VSSAVAGPKMDEIAGFARVKCAERAVLIGPFNVPRTRLGFRHLILDFQGSTPAKTS
jgi:hypothetical protein